MALLFPDGCEPAGRKAIINHAGHASVSAVAINPRAALWRAQLNRALAQEELSELYSVFESWIRQGFSDVPLDNRELAVVRRQAACMVRRKLRSAVRGPLGGDESGRLEEALRDAALVESRWPHVRGVKLSLEYKAAMARAQDLERREEGEELEPPRGREKISEKEAEPSEAEDDRSTCSGSTMGEHPVENRDSDIDANQFGDEEAF
mmetsp:Transcript_35872/g.90198  ORF Transcript_35872/g.90198 Transcript_35872/m.90198 type:complete len:207 (+) Transcript_35872:92-712(+)|eukprot:CAMPEP_0115237330 /NCGR_PEP_ID=MMETSP0270-20121206/36308_1 /TAXON_ID=71861 /ORGANISM="Scrippsiella trochoidea, Strain CCMP3099" /LENGTH=206 /DNA_ID=CAMNT_0002652215 /DNA_START=21 /DNA_END=641 /DNA_ORIENTATION=-